MGLTFSKPDRLAPGERMDGFRCGDPIVDAWAATHASRARERGTAIVYVTRCGDDIAGFYSLSVHSVARKEVSGGWFRRNAPSQVLAILLGMLGVYERYQGMGMALNFCAMLS